MIALTGVTVRLYGLLNSHVAWTLLLAGSVSRCALSLVTCYVLIAAVYDLVRPKVKTGIYPDEPPRRSQAVIAWVKLCSSLANVNAGPWKQVEELKSHPAEMSFSNI